MDNTHIDLKPPSQRNKTGLSILNQVSLPSNSIVSTILTTNFFEEQKKYRTRPASAAQIFRKKFYPQVTAAEWDDWRWQLNKRIRDAKTIGAMVNLSAAELNYFNERNDHLPMAVTPYYASLIDPDNPADPIRRSVIPVTGELTSAPEESADPLHEDGDSPVPGIIHRYPDRVLFLVTDYCSVYCRYCTRSRLVGGGGDFVFSKSQWEAALQYIAATPAIRDVLISGGDPLTLADERLEYLLRRLRAIPHVEIIRIGTKVPAVLPQRITLSLTRMLKKYHPLWISLNFMHPRELTPEAGRACQRLADAGIPLGSQTVLMAGINDSVETLKSLFHGLLKQRVRPYYLYQCDPIQGSAHFRTPVSTGLEIIRQLRGHTSGYAIPSYVIDAPGGGGKIQLLPDAVVRRNKDGWYLRSYDGKDYFYPDPKPLRRQQQSPPNGC
ncbi:MAG: KamA family radical SAM protein [Candidatus Neomarinimicrobiota bacterium]